MSDKKTFEDYMNDPDIIDEPMPLREVHAARLMIYDETKGMTPKQRAERTNRIAGAIAKKYGLKVVPSADRKDESE